MMWIIYGILVFIIQGIIFMSLTYYVAVQKGRDNKNWLWLGFFLGFFGLLTVGFVPDLTESSNMITVNQEMSKVEDINVTELSKLIGKYQKRE